MKRIAIILKIIGLVLLLGLSIGLIVMNEYSYSSVYGREYLFDIESPDNIYQAQFFRVKQELALYGEFDEIVIVDAQGHRLAVFEVFVPNAVVTPDCYEIQWDETGVLIKVTDSCVAIRVEYADILSRDVKVSPLPLTLRIVVDVLIGLIMILFVLLLFSRFSRSKLLLAIGVFIVFFCISIMGLYFINYRSIETVNTSNVDDNWGRDITVENCNSLLSSNRLNEVWISVSPVAERVNLAQIYKNMIGVEMTGSVDATNYSLLVESGVIHIDFEGSDHISFDLMLCDQ